MVITNESVNSAITVVSPVHLYQKVPYSEARRSYIEDRDQEKTCNVTNGGISKRLDGLANPNPNSSTLVMPQRSCQSASSSLLGQRNSCIEYCTQHKRGGDGFEYEFEWHGFNLDSNNYYYAVFLMSTIIID